MDRNTECRAFREQLERALEGRAAPEELAPLGWNEHLLGCESCRELFAREEALEELLAAWPASRLSPERRRVLLACLRAHAREERTLDALLDADPLVDAPRDLAARVRAGVDDARLDDLLELDRELTAPRGLAARVLDGLEDERAPAPAPRFRADRRLLWFAAAAAAVALLLQVPRGDAPREVPDIVEGPPAPVPRDADGVDDADRVLDPAARFDGVEVADAGPAGDDDLLAVLDLLEEDALWESEDLDLGLATEIDIHEEWLLEYALESEGGDDEAAVDDPGGDDAGDDAGSEVR